MVEAEVDEKGTKSRPSSGKGDDDAAVEGSSSSSSSSSDAVADQLFSQKSFEDIRKWEIETRKLVSQKKQELRHLVGGRYRDLIDAADSIVHMSRCAADIRSSIARVSASVPSVAAFKHSILHRKQTTASDAQQYTLAIQMKLLVGASEQVWIALEDRQYVEAAMTLLFSKYLVGILQRDQSTARFPIVASHLAAVGDFSKNIVGTSRRVLRDWTASEEDMLSAAVALAIINPCSLEQIIEETLDERLHAIEGIFEEGSSDDAGSALVRAADAITLTLHHIYNLFVCSSVTSVGDSTVAFSISPGTAVAGEHLLHDGITSMSKWQHVLNQWVGASTSDERSEWLENALFADSSLTSFVPASVRDFNPSRTVSLSPLPARDLHQICKKWKARVVDVVVSRSAATLGSVSSLSALAHIRGSIFQRISISERETMDAHFIPWSRLSLELCGEAFPLWEGLFCAAFTDRAKAIIRSQFSKMSHLITDPIEKLRSQKDFSPLEDHIAFFDTSHAMFETEALTSATHQSAATQESLLAAVKSMARGGVELSDAVLHTFAAAADETLHELQFYNGERREKQASTGSHEHTASRAPGSTMLAFHRKDTHVAAQLRLCIQESMTSCLQEMMSVVDGYIASATIEDDGNKDCLPTAWIEVMKLVQIARMLFNLSQTPSVAVCLLYPSLSETDLLTQSAVWRTMDPTTHILNKLKNKSNVHTKKLHSISAQLSACALACVTVWQDWFLVTAVSSKLGHGLKAYPLHDMTPWLAAWNKHTIAEETEAGETVTSAIQLPSSLSQPLMVCLSAICAECARIGLSSLPPGGLVSTCTRAFDLILSEYKTLVCGGTVDLSTTHAAHAAQEDERTRVSSTSAADVGRHVPAGKNDARHAAERDDDRLDGDGDGDGDGDDDAVQRAPISQDGYLQLLVDVEFAGDVFARAQEESQELRERYSALVSDLKAKIDPFDLNVYTPFLQSQRKAIYGCYNTFFGSFTQLKPLHASVRMAHTEASNPLRLAPVVSRFAALPIKTTEFQSTGYDFTGAHNHRLEHSFAKPFVVSYERAEERLGLRKSSEAHPFGFGEEGLETGSEDAQSSLLEHDEDTGGKGSNDGTHNKKDGDGNPSAAATLFGLMTGGNVDSSSDGQQHHMYSADDLYFSF